MKYLIRLLILLWLWFLIFWYTQSKSPLNVWPEAQQTARELVWDLQELADRQAADTDDIIVWDPAPPINGPVWNEDTQQREWKRTTDWDADIIVTDPDGRPIAEYSNEEVQEDLDFLKKYLEDKE